MSHYPFYPKLWILWKIIIIQILHEVFNFNDYKIQMLTHYFYRAIQTHSLHPSTAAAMLILAIGTLKTLISCWIHYMGHNLGSCRKLHFMYAISPKWQHKLAFKVTWTFWLFYSLAMVSNHCTCSWNTWLKLLINNMIIIRSHAVRIPLFY